MKSPIFRSRGEMLWLDDSTKVDNGKHSFWSNHSIRVRARHSSVGAPTPGRPFTGAPNGLVLLGGYRVTKYPDWNGQEVEDKPSQSSWSCSDDHSYLIEEVSINNPSPTRLHKFRRRPSVLPLRALESPRWRHSNRIHGLLPEAPLPWT